MTSMAVVINGRILATSHSGSITWAGSDGIYRCLLEDASIEPLVDEVSRIGLMNESVTVYVAMDGEQQIGGAARVAAFESVDSIEGPRELRSVTINGNVFEVRILGKERAEPDNATDDREYVCASCQKPLSQSDGRYCKECLPHDEPIAAKPTLEQRYAAFRETVERVVAEVAPDAPVTTDSVHETAERGAGMLVTFGTYSGKPDGKFNFVVPWATQVEKLELEFRDILWVWLGTVGARAMGAKK